MSQVTHDPATDHQELANDKVQIHIHRKPACRIEMTVRTLPEMGNKAKQKAIKTIGKEVSIPGFRKGRAPDAIILKKYAPDVEKERHKALADLSFAAAQELARVPVLNRNSPVSFDLQEETDAGAKLLFTFETEPSVPTIDPSLFEAKPVTKAEVGEKQIDEAIRQMRFFYAQWKAIEERPIQEGDYIMIDLDTVEGEQVQQVFHHIRFEVSKERMAAWMQKLVLGAKSGDLLEGISEPDDTASEEEKKEFKPKQVRLKIWKVEEATLPELNDHFATQVGASDIAQMRQSIFQLLDQQASDKVATQMREQVNEFLARLYPFELPRSLIETEKKHRMTERLQDARFKSQWDKMSQEERKSVEDQVIADASEAVRVFYLSRNLVDQQKIPITRLEVQQEAINLYSSHGTRPDAASLPQEAYALALSKVMLVKAQDFILKHQKT